MNTQEYKTGHVRGTAFELDGRAVAWLESSGERLSFTWETGQQTDLGIFIASLRTVWRSPLKEASITIINTNGFEAEMDRPTFDKRESSEGVDVVAVVLPDGRKAVWQRSLAEDGVEIGLVGNSSLESAPEMIALTAPPHVSEILSSVAGIAIRRAFSSD